MPAAVLLHLCADSKLKAAPVRDALAEVIATEIRRLVEGHALRFGPPGEERPIDWHDVHVLTRSDREGKDIARVLRRHGVPYAFFKQEGLFQTPEAQDVRDLLAAIEDPSDLSLRLRVYLTPFFGVLLEDLPACRGLDPSHPLVERLFRFKTLADDQAWGPLLSTVLEESGVFRRELFQKQGERELTNYLHLFEVLLEETHRRRQGLAELRGRFDAFVAGRALPAGDDGNVQRLESEREAVQILTMHKAKGLEAAVVFLAGGLTRPPHHDIARVYHEHGRRHAWIGRPPEAVLARVHQEQAQEAERLLYVALTRAKARLYLPFLGDAMRVEGDYGALHTRLTALVDGGAIEAAPALFEQRRIDVAAAASGGDTTDVAAGWDPPSALLAPLPDREPHFAALRDRHGGFIVTSYARMKRMRGAGYHAPDDAAREEARAAFDAPSAAPSPDDLPGGTGPGVFLHEVLEHIDVRTVCEADCFDAWEAREDVRALVARLARKSGIEERYLGRARALVWAAVASPLALGPVRLDGGIASVDRRLAEMSFLYPIPEPAGPRLGEALPGPDGPSLLVDRGFVRGVVDLVFEHAGRTYFLDWKSDRLPSFDAETIAAHVHLNYDLQARLYALGVLRMLGIRDAVDYDARFGGMVYAFVRGMEPAGDGRTGVCFERPTWDEVRAWEEELRSRDKPFGYPLGRTRRGASMGGTP